MPPGLRVGATVALFAAAMGCSSPAPTVAPTPRVVELSGLPAATIDRVSAPVTAVRSFAVAAPPAGPRRVRLAFTGDTLVHSPLWRQASINAGGAGYDFAPMLAGIRGLVEPADLAVCHLETPFAPPGEELSTYPLFGVPTEVAAALASTGYDRCSTASNHALDRGTAGIDHTVAALEAVGISQAGMARTPDEIEPRVAGVSGVGVGHLSYTFSYNGLRTPVDESWRSALIDPARIIADAQAARRSGAQLVIVSLHWGTEGRSAVTAAQRELAEVVTASGEVDLIVGHHAHVLQPIEQVNGVWVLFGLGNIVSNLTQRDVWPAQVRDGAVARVDVVIDGGAVRVLRPMVEPTWVDIDAGWSVRPVRATLADPTIGAGLRAQLEASLARSMEIVGPYVPA